MPIKYSTYDSSSGNTFALTTVTGVSGTFTDQLSGNIYKTTGGVVVISGSGDVKPYGLFSFPNTSGSSGSFLVASTSGTTEWRVTKNVNYQLFNSSDTWTKPSGISVVYVELIGGGAGGNAGANGIANSSGGGGGAAGTFLWQTFNAANISGTVTVTVGAGGSGRPSVTGSGQGGALGNDGGASSFGNYLDSLITRRPATSASFQIGSSGSLRGAFAYTTANGGNGGPSAGVTALFAGGGGGGARQGTSPGGAGGYARWLTTTTGVGASGGDPSGNLNGADAVANEGGGGGGGAASGNGEAGNGGNGAYPGGGGGGGASSASGFNSGAGGNGAPGFVKVICW